jgi:hypothetical protein
LAYGSEVVEDYMQAACPTVGLMRGALDVDAGCGLSEEWRFDIQSRLPLAECLVYLVGLRGWPKAEGITVVVGVVIHGEVGEVGVCCVC